MFALKKVAYSIAFLLVITLTSQAATLVSMQQRPFGTPFNPVNPLPQSTQRVLTIPTEAVMGEVLITLDAMSVRAAQAQVRASGGTNRDIILVGLSQRRLIIRQQESFLQFLDEVDIAAEVLGRTFLDSNTLIIRVRLVELTRISSFIHVVSVSVMAQAESAPVVVPRDGVVPGMRITPIRPPGYD